MSRVLCWDVSPEEAGLSVQAFLRRRGFTRRILTQLKGQTALFLNGRPPLGRLPLQVGDRLEVRLTDETPTPFLTPWPTPLRLAYEDQDLAVIDKPAGMPVHPSQGHREHTLAAALAARYQGEHFVFRPVHRLDKDTSGLIVVARHRLAAAVLSQQLQDGEMRREYLAAARGLCPESGVIQAPIGRMEGSSIARCVRYDGEAALTYFQRLGFSHGYSLLRLRLETGRTHQIRVHLQHIGHPIPGDFLYCPDPSPWQRQALHSYRLSLRHPITGQPLAWTAPPPADLADFFACQQ